jgi:hypothetical protein
MNLGVVKAYMLKEFRELIRSKMIVIVYLLPTMIIILFGYGIRMEVTHARTLVIDNDHTTLSRELAAKFEHSKYFDTTVSYRSEAWALRQIKQAKADLIVIIPVSFETHLLKGVESEVGVFIDGAFPNRAMTIESYVQGVVLDTAREAAKNLQER